MRRLHGTQQVTRLAGTADAQQYIAGLPKRAQLPRVDVVESRGVGYGGEAGAVAIECQCGQGWPVFVKPAQQVAGEQLRQRAVHAVAAGDNFAVLQERLDNQFAGLCERLRQFIDRQCDCFYGALEVVGD